MQVTITNAATTKTYVSMLWGSIDVGGSQTVSRTAAQIEAEGQLASLVAAGLVTLSFVLEAADSLVSAPGLLPVFDDASRPNPATLPAGSVIWNSVDLKTNISDGTDWKDPAGITT